MNQATQDGLENVVTGLGTERDKRSYTRFGAVAQMTAIELESMYRSSWLAKRIVNSVADDMTREWRQLHFSEKHELDLENLEKLEKALCVKDRVNEALRWARLYGGALLVIGTKDKDMATPLNPETIRQGDLKWLRVIDRWRVSGTYAVDYDLASDNYLLPEFYLAASDVNANARIHHSRVLRFNGQTLPYNAWQANGRWDDSELQHVMDSVKNYGTTTDAIATMLFEANVDVLGIDELRELLSANDGEAKLIKRFQIAMMAKSYNRTLIIDKNDSYQKHSNSFTGLDAVLNGFISDVCGAADIPATRLFGQSAGGLNSTGDNDIRNYYDMVSGKQEKEMRVQLERLDQIMVRSALGFVPDDYRFDFNNLWQTSDTEQAAVDKSRADTDQIYFSTGILTEGAIARELKARGTYRTMTDEDVELAEGLSDIPELEEAIPGEVPGIDPEAAPQDQSQEAQS